METVTYKILEQPEGMNIWVRLDFEMKDKAEAIECAKTFKLSWPKSKFRLIKTIKCEVEIPFS